MSETVSFGPVDVNQRTAYREYQKDTCGVAWDDTVPCPANQFESKRVDCPVGPHQKKCSFPDERLCWKVPDWSRWATGEYLSGTTLNDAKVRCQWDNVPRQYMTKKNVEMFKREYGDANKAYDDVMAGFCMKQTRRCMLDPDTGLPMRQCANVHSGDENVRQLCSGWWNDIKGTRRGDDYIPKACPEGSFGLRGDCSCALASTESTDYQAIQAMYTGFPARCWFRPCMDGSTRTQFRPSEHESATCEGAICVTKNDFSVEMANIIDSVVVQEARCNIDRVNGEFTTGEGTSSASTTPTTEDNATTIVLVVVVVIAIIAVMSKNLK